MIGPVIVRFPPGIRYRYLSLTAQPRGAINHPHAIFLQQVLNATRELLRNGTAKLHQFLQIDIHLTHADAQLTGMGDTVRDLSAMQQRLGWNASPVQADAAQMLFFH
ncbi:unknown [Klebsiella variicola CAG:634]|nr:unknown [Klebsiella variicola CAG:634]